MLNPHGVAILFFYPLGVRVRVGAPHRYAQDGPGQPLPYRAPRRPHDPWPCAGNRGRAGASVHPAHPASLRSARGPARAGGAVVPPAGPGRGLAQEPGGDRGRGRAIDLVCFTGIWPSRGGALPISRSSCCGGWVSGHSLFAVPGNRDMDRKIEVAAWRALRDQIGPRDAEDLSE